MKITKEMINPELRFMGTMMRRVWPCFTAKRDRLSNRVLDAFTEGKAFTLKADYDQIYIPRPDGSKLRLCIYMPKEHTGIAPGLLWIHGGGYSIGTPEQDFMFIERAIEAAGCVVIAPDYARSLEAVYPAALDDCYLTLMWMKAHCKDYGIRPDQLFVGGDSAGGGLTAALCMYARDKKEASIAFQMPLYPMMDDRMQTASSQDNDAPVWNTKSNEIAWELYLGDLYKTDRVPKYAAPGRETDYAGLPPALTFVGTIDPFRDETVQYMENLRAAGVEAKYELFEGCFHGFDCLCAWTDIAKRANRFAMDGLRHAAQTHFKPQPE